MLNNEILKTLNDDDVTFIETSNLNNPKLKPSLYFFKFLYQDKYPFFIQYHGYHDDSKYVIIQCGIPSKNYKKTPSFHEAVFRKKASETALKIKELLESKSDQRIKFAMKEKVASLDRDVVKHLKQSPFEIFIKELLLFPLGYFLSKILK